MKELRADKLRNLSPEELGEKERSLREELFNLRYQAKTSRLENPRRIRELRRALARIKTIEKEKSESGEGKG